ncbi:MAG: hypothetical protein V9G98_02915 [Candidatus Competibacter sp.]
MAPVTIQRIKEKLFPLREVKATNKPLFPYCTPATNFSFNDRWMVGDFFWRGQTVVEFVALPLA